jgi:cobalt-zinc-cadmium efflux system protein
MAHDHHHHDHNAHHHHHHHGHHHHHTSDNIRVAFLLNFVFTLLEFIGGALTNSLAIMSDALHDLGDSVSLGLAWYLENKSNQSATNRYTYGYRRLSLLGALINTVILIVGSLIILAHAVPRILNPEPTDAQGMLIFAILGIAVNGIAALRLSRSESMNARVATWHLLEDALGWVAVLIVSIVLFFVDLYILDPILSVLITLYILYNVIKNLNKTLALFLQAVPETVDVPQLEHELSHIPHVISTHHTHVWSLDGEHHVLTTHVVVESGLDRQTVCEIKDQIRQIITNKSFEHITIDIEYENEPCIMSVP